LVRELLSRGPGQPPGSCPKFVRGMSLSNSAKFPWVLVSDMSRPGLRSPNLVVPMACSWVCTSRASSFRESVTASGGRLAGLAAGGRQRGPRVVAAHGQLAQRRGTRPTQVGIHAVVDSVRGHPRPVPGPDRVRVLVVHILQRRPVRLPDRVQVGLDHWSSCYPGFVRDPALVGTAGSSLRGSGIAAVSAAVSGGPLANPAVAHPRSAEGGASFRVGNCAHIAHYDAGLSARSRAKSDQALHCGDAWVCNPAGLSSIGRHDEAAHRSGGLANGVSPGRRQCSVRDADPVTDQVGAMGHQQPQLGHSDVVTSTS
jgi:hypothetical protein